MVLDQQRAFALAGSARQGGDAGGLQLRLRQLHPLAALAALAAAQLRRGFEIIGIHTPEVEAHRDRASIVAGVEKLGIDFPVLVDNQFHYWRALENRYWPSWYLVDRKGMMSERFVGETQVGDEWDKLVRSGIEALLAQP